MHKLLLGLSQAQSGKEALNEIIALQILFHFELQQRVKQRPQRKLLQLMWNQPRKSYRSPQKSTTQPQRLSTTCLVTPGKAEKQSVRHPTRQCPLHFNQPSHVCLTCRKSICLRCALTYCHQHVIRNQGEAIFELREELIKLELCPRMQEIASKLQQSRQRQQYLQKKVLRLIQGIEGHFQYIVEMLAKKKLQIIQFYDQQFQKYLQEHRNFDQQMRQRTEWLRSYTLSDSTRLSTIEEIDHLSAVIKRAATEDAKMEKKITKLLMGKDKIRIQQFWSEENLEKVLFEIESIPFRVEQKGRSQKRKKRLTTENVNDRHHTLNNVKSSSNSRFPSSRKLITPST